MATGIPDLRYEPAVIWHTESTTDNKILPNKKKRPGNWGMYREQITQLEDNLLYGILIYY